MSFALITGASKGIGKAMAYEFASKKKNILLVARSENLLSEISKDICKKYNVDVYYLAIDLAEENAAKKVKQWCFDNIYTVDVLVNNAGYGLSGSFEKYTYKEYQAMMQVNMNVPLQLIQEFLPSLKENKQSYILNIASAAAYQAVPGLNVYAGTKSFILSMSRSLSFELRNTNISVTCVSPGATESDFANRANVTGEKALKMAEKVNMKPEAVAKFAIKAMYAKKTEAIPGFLNRATTFFVWLLPKKISEKMAADIYDL
ncbi:MAG: SDR family NAD(P)-dependent oxidoreductase [Chitinophagaceae bacterium]